MSGTTWGPSSLSTDISGDPAEMTSTLSTASSSRTPGHSLFASLGHSDFERELNWLYSPLGNQGPSVRRRRALAQVTLHRALHPHRMESLRAPMRTSATTSVTQSQQADLQVGEYVLVHWTSIPHRMEEAPIRDCAWVSQRCSETPRRLALSGCMGPTCPTSLGSGLRD